MHLLYWAAVMGLISLEAESRVEVDGPSRSIEREGSNISVKMSASFYCE